MSTGVQPAFLELIERATMAGPTDA